MWVASSLSTYVIPVLFNKNSSANICRSPFIKLIIYSTRFVIIKTFIKKIFASTILTPKNATVEESNDYAMSLIPEEEKTYLSCDSPLSTNSAQSRSDDIHTPEFLNTINASGIPNHKIKLKVEVHVMLLRNLDPTTGLCNGTRLIITKMGRYVLEGKVITGSNIGDTVYIPRLSLTPSDTRIPFKF